MKAVLALQDGSMYEAISFGAEGERLAEVSFYTGVVGYQEVSTSSSNANKFILMTYPLIGNYGTAKKFNESGQSRVAGLIIKEKSRISSNWQAEKDFVNFLKKENILAIEGLDTQAVMVQLRRSGEQLGIISTKDFNEKSLKKKLEKAEKQEQRCLDKICVKKITRICKGSPAIGILDIGVSNNLLKQLKLLGCEVSLIPYSIPAQDILKLLPKGMLISDGPEADRDIYAAIDTVKKILGKIPILGIGTGCQVLARAMGARIRKMPLGHHGVNYPVMRPGSLKGEITHQNHSYAIQEDTLSGKDIEVTWRNLNDNTVEGIKNNKLNAEGFQFDLVWPAAGQTNPFLDNFIQNLK